MKRNETNNARQILKSRAAAATATAAKKVQIIKCALCTQTVTGILRPGITCYHCSKAFHASCLKISLECLISLGEADANWACSSCKSKSRRSSIFVPSQEKEKIADVTVSETPKNDKAAVNGNSLSRLSSDMAKLMAFQTSAEKSLQFFSDEFDKLKTSSDIVQSQSKLIKDLQQENIKLRSAVKDLELKVEEILQVSNEKDLILTGIPEIESRLGTTTGKLVADFAGEIGFNLYQSDIKECRRLRFSDSTESTTNPRASSSSYVPKAQKILLKLHDKKTRDDLKSFIRDRKRETKYVDFHSCKVDFYASDHLTGYFNHLFVCTKSFAKDNNFSFVWVNGSNIFIKKQKDSKAFSVKSLNDLYSLRLVQETKQ